MMRRIFTLLFLLGISSIVAKAVTHTFNTSSTNQWVPVPAVICNVGDIIKFIWTPNSGTHNVQSQIIPSGAAPFGVPTPIPLDGTNQSFSYPVTVPGQYTFHCTFHQTMQGGFQANPNSISNVSKDIAVKISPNPAHNNLFVQTEMKAPFFRVYDITGRSVLETNGTATGTGYNIDVHKLAAGNYTLILSSKEGVAARRITIAR